MFIIYNNNSCHNCILGTVHFIFKISIFIAKIISMLQNWVLRVRVIIVLILTNILILEDRISLLLPKKHYTRNTEAKDVFKS